MTTQIIEHFYEGILAPESWSLGLNLLCKLVGSEHAALTTWNRITNSAGVHESVGLSDACRFEFTNHYSALDPARDWVDRIPIGDWYIDHYHVGSRSMQRSAFYQDFMRKFGLSSINATHLMRDDVVNSFLVIQHGLGLPFHRQYATENMASVISHLKRALHLKQHCETITQKNNLAFAMLTQLRSPMLIVDAGGKIIFANQAAESLLSKQSLLQVAAGRISLSGPDRTKLLILIRTACGCEGPAIAGGLGISSLIDNLHLQIIITPLPVHHIQTSDLNQPLAILLVRDPELPYSNGTELLKQIYGLTISEARISLLILHGANPSQAAMQAGVSLATVRTQLRSIFRKTGATRQADLMRLLIAVLI
jgi:DNA-binding CsgD family transcriptional regulator